MCFSKKKIIIRRKNGGLRKLKLKSKGVFIKVKVMIQSIIIHLNQQEFP